LKFVKIPNTFVASPERGLKEKGGERERERERSEEEGGR